MARSFNVSFNITGTLDGSLQAALRSASNAMRGLGESARAASNAARASQAGLAGLANSLNSMQAAAAKFRELKKALQDTKTALSSAQGDANRLASQFNKDKAAVAELSSVLERLQRARAKEIKDQNVNRAQLNLLREQRLILKERLRLLGAKGNKIPRELLGTQKGQQISQLLAQSEANKLALETARQRFREAQAIIQNLTRGISETREELKKANQAASQSGYGFNNARNNAARLKETLSQQFAALQQLRTQLGAAGFNVSNFASSEARLESEINRVNAALQRQQALLNAQQRSQQASQDMFNAYGNFQNALQTAEAIATPFTNAIDKAIEFEHSMSTLKSISQMDLISAGKFDEAEANMKRLETQAKKLGAETIYKSQEIAEAQIYIARTGWDTDKIEAAIPPILKLAAANRMAIEPTADIVTNVMTAFGHGIDQLEHDTDVFAYTVTHSNQILSQFGEAMKYAAPVAKNFGASIEETAMMTKFMGDAGIQGSMAGTSMRQTMLRLIAPPKKATKAMAEYGITLDDANAAWQNANAVAKEYGVTLDETLSPGRQFISVMEQIDQNMGSASDREKLAAISAITGINAVSGAANVFGAGANQAKNFTELLENCRGTLNQVYDVMTDDTFGAQKSFESAWEAVQLAVGTSLLKIARTAYEAFTPMLAGVAQFADEHPAIVQAAAGIAAALAGVVVSAAAVKLAFAGWSFVTAQIALVQAALASLGSGALLGGLIGRLAALRTALFGLGGAATLSGWGRMFSTIAAQAAAARVAITGFFASLSLSSMVSGVTAAISSVGTAIAGAARAAMMFAFSPIGAALMALALAGLYCYQNWNKVAPVLSNIASIITGSLSGALSTIAPAIQNVMTAFGNLADALGASGIFSTLGMIITGVLASIATGVAGALATVVNTVAAIVSAVANVLSGIVNLVSAIISGNWSAAWDAAKSIATSALEGIGNVAKNIFDGVLSTVQAIGDVWSTLKGGASTVPHGKENHVGGGGDFDTPAPVQVSTPETPPINTSATQAGLDAVGQAAQTAAAQMDGVNTATQNISQVGDALANLPAALQPTQDALANLPAAVDPATQGLSNLGTQATTAGTNVGTFGTQAQTAATSVQSIATNAGTAGTNVGTLGTNAGTASGTVQTLGTNAGTAGVAMSEVPGHAANLNAGLELPIGNLGALGTAAGNAVGNIDAMSSAAGAVAGALRGKAAEIAAIHIQAPTVSTGGAVAANAEGGIYRKGAFLTTFAEKSPEAAIPLDNSKRAKSLWETVGQMLGILPRAKKEPLLDGYEPKIIMHPTSANGLPTRGDEPPAIIEFPQPIGRQPSPAVQRRRDRGGRINLPRVPSTRERIMPRVNRIPPSQGIPSLIKKIPFPLMTPPTFPTYEEKREESGGLFGRLIDGLTGGGTRSPELAAPAINVTVHVTINGNADEATVKRGVEGAMPTVQKSLTAQLRDYRREQLRRSYA